MKRETLAKLLLDWYQKSGRDLPWRVKGGPHPDPYAVLVSELMLQQTTVKTVIPYFARFMQKFPTIAALAAAPLEEVYLYWQGLGYYTRAKSLHQTAKLIITEFGGNFPQTKKEVLSLKGIGPYTAASFLALAFNQNETVVDGNVIRIICRLYNLEQAPSKIMPLIRQKAEALTDQNHPADYASAIMDLGALICTPTTPHCELCPWQAHCLARKKGTMTNLPLRETTAKPEKIGKVYLVFNNENKILIRKRSEKGLLSGLYEFPWELESTPVFALKAQQTNLSVSHIFTHFRLNLQIYILRQNTPFADGFFISEAEIKNYPFSTLMKKVYKTYSQSQKTATETANVKR